MTQRKIDILIDEIYSKPPKTKYLTNKTNVYYIDDTKAADILDLKDYGPGSNSGYRYVLVVIVIFSKFGWTVPLKNKNSQTTVNSFEKIISSSKRRADLIESGKGIEFFNKIFTNLLRIRNIRRYSRNTSVGAAFAERVHRTNRDPL